MAVDGEIQTRMLRNAIAKELDCKQDDIEVGTVL